MFFYMSGHKIMYHLEQGNKTSAHGCLTNPQKLTTRDRQYYLLDHKKPCREYSFAKATTQMDEIFQNVSTENTKFRQTKKCEK